MPYKTSRDDDKKIGARAARADLPLKPAGAPAGPTHAPGVRVHGSPCTRRRAYPMAACMWRALI